MFENTELLNLNEEMNQEIVVQSILTPPDIRVRFERTNEVQPNEIERAERLRDKYFKNKEKK